MGTQALVIWSSAFTAAAGLLLITVYSCLAPWWRSTVGKMMMTYAVALTALSGLVSLGLGLGVDLVWIRIARSILILIVGGVMLMQVFLIIREQVKRKRS